MNKRRVGTFYEHRAIEYLKERGIVIIDSNFQCHAGEIDLIGMDGSCTVFFEVKYRKNNRFGTPQEAVTYQKQRKICRCAMIYCQCHPNTREIRYDVIAITENEIEWIQNAFMHVGYSLFL